MIVYFTLKKYDLKVIPITPEGGSALPANRSDPGQPGERSTYPVPDGEESIELIKISRLHPSADGLRSKL